ncbi:MAG: CDGSH iron-sulfur domain-containing protein [Phycisphaerales bacterium]|nr:CDGSH iron-sulfur domain-containing protein [Phycisphaerales bacterium]
MASEPVVAQKAPYPVTLQPGEYYWCACGKSKNQPFCDGSHAGSGISPVAFKIEAEKKVFLCGCKHSEHKPFCDGFHKKL